MTKRLGRSTSSLQSVSPTERITEHLTLGRHEQCVKLSLEVLEVLDLVQGLDLFQGVELRVHFVLLALLGFDGVAQFYRLPICE